jgi:outer membrane biosynthesis protein TonB
MKGFKYSLLCGAAALLLAASGCMRAQARVIPELPPLDVPAPPPRIVEAVVLEPPPLPAEPQEELPVDPPRPRAQTPAQRPETPKPEPPRVETPPPPEPPRAAEESKQPQGTLQTSPAGSEVQLERTIKDLLGRAMANLSRVDYAGLNADARTQYDQARRFISQAQDALREKNLVFAQNLADKANTLAAQLPGR